MGKDIKVKKWASFLPSWVWCVLLDLADIVSNIVSVLVSILGITIPVGVGIDLVFDAIQTLVALAIFDDTMFALVNIDFILPQGLDILPTYTAKYVYFKFIK